jgi:hypothetical protein
MPLHGIIARILFFRRHLGGQGGGHDDLKRSSRPFRPEDGPAVVSCRACGIGGWRARPVGLLALWNYPGRLRPFVNEEGAPLPNRVSEEVFIDVGGTRQD